MDPLSITASTIAVITVVSASFKGAARLYSAPGEIESVLNDLADTQVILKSIEEGLLQYTASPRCDQGRLRELAKRLLQVKSMVQELSKSIKLDTLQAKPNTPSARWAWLRAKGKVLKVRNRVETLGAEIVRLQGSFERATIHLELQHVTLLSSELKTNNQTLLDNSQSASDRLQQIEVYQRQQADGMLSLRQSQEQLLRLMEEGRSRNSQQSTHTTRSRAVSNNSGSSHFSKGDTVVISTAYRPVNACDPGCFCACHSQSAFETPHLLQQAVGRLFIGYAGVPLLMKPCDTEGCKRRTRQLWYTQYQFPKWYLQQSLLPLFAVVASFQPPKFTLEVPRVIGPDSPVFQFALTGDLMALQSAFAAGLASPTDINGKTGRTLLHYAFVRKHNPSIVKMLLQQGADPYIKDESGWQVTDTIWETRFSTGEHDLFSDVFTSELPAEKRFTELHLTILKYRHDDIEDAIKRLACSTHTINTVDSNGRTALAWAAHRSDVHVVRKLLEHGADTGIGDKYGVVPLHLTAHSNSTKCMELLLSYNAQVDQMDIHGRTAAHYACEYQDPVTGHAVSMLRMLQKAGADVVVADKYSRTGLHKSAAVGNIESLDFLLSEGCEKDKLDDWGKSALVDTIKRNQQNALRTLLRSGANYLGGFGVERDTTVLHLLASDGDLTTLEIVYKERLAGLNINSVDRQGRTAQGIFDARTPQPEADVMGLWFMLLTQLEGDEYTDTGSEASWLFEEALESQPDVTTEAKKVYGLG